VSVDGIAPGDMHGLRGRNSHGNEEKTERQTVDEPSGRKASLSKCKAGE